MKNSIIFSIVLTIFSMTSLIAQIDSQWRGQERDGKYEGEKLLKSWPTSGPELLTTIKDLGKGWSSPAVTNDRIYITGMEDDVGYLYAFNMAGKKIWKKSCWDIQFRISQPHRSLIRMMSLKNSAKPGK